MIRKITTMIFAVLALLVALAACAPTAPQPLLPNATSTVRPPLAEPNSAYPSDPGYPAPQASPTTAAPTTAPTDEPTAAPTEPTPEVIELPSPWVSYIGADENLWIINPDKGEMRQITQDAQPFQPGVVNIVYCCGVWSSDGKYMAYSRQVGTPVAEGYNYDFGLWVFDLDTGQSREVVADQQIATFSWQPGTHNLTYGLSIPNEYFSMHQVDSNFATGIWSLNVDTGTAAELVPPSNGFLLVNPIWSPDGRYVGFDEVYQMEGRGNFAYYEVAAGAYYPWNKAIGGYRWSQDGELLYYDYLTYAPSGTERIFRNNRNNTDEQQLSPEVANTIHFSPLLTPDGSQVIYIAEEMLGEGNSQYQLMIQPTAGGDARSLGGFEQPGEMSISSDGRLLLFSAGPWDSRQIQMITLADGSARSLVQGKQPVWQR